MTLISAVSALWASADPLVRAVVLVTALLLARHALVLLLRAASALPGSLGHRATAVASALRPGLARRVLALTLGLGMPASGALSAVAPAAAASVATTARVPLAASPPSIGATLAVATKPLRSSTVGATPEVVVASGDTLWDIARHHLPRGASDSAIAAQWPRWYALNRDRIGPDPSLLRIGTPLRVPVLRRTGTSASQHHRPPPAPAPTRTPAQSLDPDRR